MLVANLFRAAFLVLLLIFIIMAYAHAHETKTGWLYDPSCCNDTHCHPVEDGTVEDKRDGVSVTGFGILSYSDPRLRWSRDNGDHVCTSNGKLLCVYRRPRDM